MATYGQPQRDATRDANAGVVNPPTVREAQRKVATREVIDTSATDGMGAFGQAMGNALASRLSDEAQNINEQRATDAAIRQGQEHAINSIDAASKRTGWEKAVFGESVEYRAAQQRAAQNAVQAAYLEEATKIDDYAGETPEEYQSRLKSGLDKVLEPYGNDVETKRLVTSAYQTMAGKLAAKQYESHYAYNQEQQRTTTYNQVLQTFDQWSVDSGLVSSKEEQQGLFKNAEMFFAGKTKPQGMTDIAWKGVVNEALVTSLRSGNIGAYNAAKVNGWLDNMSAKERVAFDQAVSAYDTDFSQNVQLAYETAELSALEAPNLNAAAAIYQKLRNELDSLATRSSGTERAELALARGHTSAQKGINAAKAEAKRIGDKALKEAEKNELKQKQIDAALAAIRNPDPIAKSGALAELDMKSTELTDVMDLSIVQDVGRLVGNSEITESEAVQSIMGDPAVAKTIATRLRGSQIDSKIVKRSLETFLNGYQGLVDPETGQLNQKGIVAMQSISQFAQNEDTFKSMVGDANYDKYEIVRRGLAAGQTIDMVNKDVDKYFTNKGNRDQYAIDWSLKKDESKRDRVRSLYQRYTGQQPNGASLAYAQEELDRGLVVHQGDMKEAEKYLKISLQNASITYQGRTLVNGKHLNDVTGYNFEQLLDGAQVDNGQGSLMTPFLLAAGMKIDDDNVPATLNKNMNIYTVDGTDGFFIDSPDQPHPVRISSDVMKAWAAELDQRKKFRDLEEQSHGQNLDAWIEEQEMLRNAPYGAGFY